MSVPHKALDTDWLLANLSADLPVVLRVLIAMSERADMPNRSLSVAELVAEGVGGKSQIHEAIGRLKGLDWQKAFITPPPSPSKVVSKPKRVGVGADYPIPEALDTPEFRKAWAEWHVYRRQQGLQPWAERTCRLHMELFAKWGAEASCASIEQSILRSWLGLFEPEAENVPHGARWRGPATTRQANEELSLENDKAEAVEFLFRANWDGSLTEDRRDELLEVLKALPDRASVAAFLDQLPKVSH